MRQPRLVALLSVLLLVLPAATPPARAACPGDCDGSGGVTPTEAAGVRSAALGRTFGCDGADADGSGRVTVRDAMLAARAATAGSCAVTVHVTGRVLFDDGTPIAGASVTAAVQVPAPPAPALSPVVLGANGKPGRVPRSQRPSVSLASSTPPVFTGADGTFALDVAGVEVPADILVRVEFQPAEGPLLDNARVAEAGGSALAVGDILLPSLAGAKIDLAGGAGSTPDDDVRVAGLPPGVNAVYAQSYDPDQQPEAFPGDFTEQGKLPLDSQGFQFVQPVDESGNPISEVDDPALLQGKLPSSQLPGVVDVMPGTDRIEIPIYSFNEATGQWEEHGLGWVQDENGAILPEAAQSAVQNDQTGGKLYAAFPTEHFSWFNVDYPYVGPWQLGSVPRELRNTDCFYRALRLAEAFIRSPLGAAAFGLVNAPGGSLDEELADGDGPFIMTRAILPSSAGVRTGWYEGDAIPLGGLPSEIWMNSLLWSFCDDPERADQLVLYMASVILHETAHWKDDAYKFPTGDGGPLGPGDTRGDEGRTIEQVLLGGSVNINPFTGDLLYDGLPMPDEVFQRLIRPWDFPPGGVGGIVESGVASPLTLDVNVPAGPFAPGESIPATVTWRNDGTETILVIDPPVLEDLPLRFDLARQPTGEPVGFLGIEAKTELALGAFVSLAPGQEMTRVIDLVLDDGGVPSRYSLRSAGTYCGTAVHAAVLGVPETRSATFCVEIGGGGSIQGVVRRAVDGVAIAGATVRALRTGAELGSATTNAAGEYRIDSLPPGTFNVEASASGFLTGQATGVNVTSGGTTTANVNLSALLTAGQVRFVLSWGATPEDLDSHLWLPVGQPHHVYFGNRGDTDDCPHAFLDRDDTDGDGPETMTITERRASGTYRYAVYNYSGESPLAGSGARVEILDEGGLQRTITVPATGLSRWWHVADVDAATGAVTEINQLVADPTPYYVSDSCPEEDCFTPGDEDEDGLVDCLDTLDCRDSLACAEDDATECGNGQDDDGDGAVDCADFTCRDVDACSESGEAECSNGQDDDGDTLTDCADPQCDPICEENTDAECGNGQDDDGDELTDCADVSCVLTNPCSEFGDECFDDADNDGDGNVDCADFNCDTFCLEYAWCDDDRDNDSDGLVDCADADDCRYAIACDESTFEKCSNGIDENSNGLVDCADFSCLNACDERFNCGDGNDNDSDGFVDCADVADCTEGEPCTETEDECFDGADNDGDEAVDCADADCTYICTEEGYYCLDGRDNDGDGFVDCVDADCDPTCSEWDCFNGQDDDANELVDCADPECATSCTESGNCGDARDNDSNGLTDCADPACEGQCVEYDCHDGQDEDLDGDADCADSDCVVPCDESLACWDEIDNDADGFLDCGDPQCELTCDEAQNCADGWDNDLNGFTDCQDAECATACVEAGRCADQLDNDQDGFMDCQDSECAATCDESTQCNDLIDNDQDGAYDCYDADCSDEVRADCNGIPDDGCEVSLLSNPNNCGACGSPCPPGWVCSGGTCVNP